MRQQLGRQPPGRLVVPVVTVIAEREAVVGIVYVAVVDTNVLLVDDMMNDAVEVEE